jgi:hypothetical protein
MRQHHASQLQRSDAGHQLKVGQRANTDQLSDISGARQHTNVPQRPDGVHQSKAEQRHDAGQQYEVLKRSHVEHQAQAGPRHDAGRYLFDDGDIDHHDHYHDVHDDGNGDDDDIHDAHVVQDDYNDNDDNDDVGQQSGVFRHPYFGQQVTVGKRPHDARQRSDLEQRSGMGQQASLGQYSDADQRADVRQRRDGESSAKVGQRSNVGHVFDRIDSKQQLFELCQQRLVDTNSSYRYNSKTSNMEEVKIHPMKNLEDLNEMELTDEFLTDTDMMLRKMCNLGYDFNTKKSSRAYDDSNCDTAYYESTNDADDDAEDDDEEEEDEDGGDDERAIYCSEKAEDFVKSQLRKQTNPISCDRSCCQSSLNSSSNDQTIKNACYHQTFMNLAVSVLWYMSM